MISVYNPSRKYNKNLLINPAFLVVQKEANGTLADSLALPTASLGYKGGTNWFEAATGGTPAYTYDSAAQSFTLTGASGVTFAALGQRIESKDANNLRNKTVTLSVELSNSLLTRVDWTIQRPTTTNDVHGTIGTPTQTVIASGFWTVNSTLTRYQATFVLPDLASRGLEIRFSVFAQTSGTWVVTRPQLEEGNIATNFNCDDYSQELLKCQRYFKSFFGNANSPVAGAYAVSTPMFPPMFSTTPVLASSGGTLTAAVLLAESFANDVFGIAITASAPNGNVENRLEQVSAHIP